MTDGSNLHPRAARLRSPIPPFPMLNPKDATQVVAKSIALAVIFSAMSGAVAETGNSQPNREAFRADFEGADAAKLWPGQGQVTLDSTEIFKGKQSLLLELPENNLRQKVSVVGPTFPISPGAWEVKIASRSRLVSQDNSYNGTVVLEMLGTDGMVLAKSFVVEQVNNNPWQPVARIVDVPAGVVSARIVAAINKETPGKFWIDEVIVAPLASDRKPETIQRLTFSSAQEGNLLFPGDPKTFTVSLLSTRPLPKEDLNVSCVLRDYWGAEQAEPITVKLDEKARQNDLFAYAATLDLAGQPIEEGRYYELHGEILRKDSPPYRNFTSFAVLPEAATNAYEPAKVPFTSRNWDNVFPEFIRLTKRLGIRVVGGSVKWDFNPPFPANLAQEPLIRQEGLGVLTTTMAMRIERRGPEWEKWDEIALRESIRNFLTKYKDVQPMIINLGNEPHNKGNDVLVDVRAYRTLYEEIKKVDPNIYVVGTSVGTTNEEYFKAGFGEWCDAYDFHVYEPAEKVRDILQVQYPAMFKKYGFAKPIWSTELGLNSQGMKRQTVASELIKKFANFFAGGGANVSWFGLLYPDPDGSKGGTSASAHNVFDCRYNVYAPKLDAIAYYNAVNGIAVKKFVTDKSYASGIQAFLFQDAEGQTLQVLYKRRGREDVFVPMDGVKEVRLIRIDGRSASLDAAGKGLTLTVDEDPILLLYRSGPQSLPAELGKPEIALVNAPAAIISGKPLDIDVKLNGPAFSNVELHAPPFWKVQKGELTDGVGRFKVTSPDGSSVREGDLRITLKNSAGKAAGDVIFRPTATGIVSLRVLPVAASETKPAGIDLVISNNGTADQEVTWDVALIGEQFLKDGVFSSVAQTTAYFEEAPTGTLKLRPGETSHVFVPIAGVDPIKLYRVSASVRDAKGRTTVVDRPMGGFVAVPRVKSAIKLDGVVDEADWNESRVQVLGAVDQVYVVLKKQNPAPRWEGTQDLSAKLRFLWDDEYLYAAVEVVDDLTGKAQPGRMLWAQDGIQMLIDSDRGNSLKGGKSDYAMGVGMDGPQAWCFLAGDPSVSPGDAPDIKVSASKRDEKSGAITYEMAIPWSRLAPFKPAPGANLGLTLAINEDDGPGRDSYITWFGSVQTKDVDTAGDLILQK